MTDSVEVTQADRDLLSWLMGWAEDSPEQRRMNKGHGYSAELERLAAHRLASEQSSQAQIAAMREALERISRGGYDGLEVTHMSASACRYIARQALSTLGSQS